MAKKTCAVCHYFGKAKSTKSNLMFLILLSCGIWPGVLYGLFYNPPSNICPKCGASAMVLQVAASQVSTVTKKREPLEFINAVLWTLVASSLLLSVMAFTDPQPQGAGIVFLIVAPLLSPWVHRLVYRATRPCLSRRKTRRVQIDSEIEQAGSGEESEFLLGSPEDGPLHFRKVVS